MQFASCTPKGPTEITWESVSLCHRGVSRAENRSPHGALNTFKIHFGLFLTNFYTIH